MRTDLWGDQAVLSVTEIERIHRESLAVLGEMGVRVPDGRLQEAAAAQGASVQRAAGVVRFPERVVTAAIEAKRLAWEAKPKPPGREPGRKVLGAFSGAAVRIHDMDTGVVRSATYADMLDSVRLANTLDCVSTCTSLILPRDVPDGCEDLYQFYGSVKLSRKPVVPTVLNLKSAEPIHDILMALLGSREAVKASGRFFHRCYSTSPLTYAQEGIDIAFKVHDMGYPVAFGAPMVVSGATGPVTAAGTLVLSNAESLAGMCLTHALGHEPHYGAVPVIMDQRSGQACYADPRKLVLGMASRDLTRWYGFPEAGFHVGLDALHPGIQASVERVFTSMLGLFLYDVPLHVRLGILGPAGAVASLAQVLIDAELVGMLNAFMAGIEVTEETLAADLIRQVGHGGTYLDREHTAEHFRREMWLPKYFERNLPAAGTATDMGRILRMATEDVKRILATEQPRPLSREQELEIDAVVSRAGHRPR